jgi:hypothetical protein
MAVSRRRFLATAGAGAVLAGASTSFAQAPGAGAAPATPPAPGAAPGPAPLPDLYPTQPPELVREVVTVAHFNFARVRELVTRQPSLARATWDWGFGDWESALGAASHMGNREIAEYLIANGARPDMFSAAMLGQLDVVRSLIAASPGVQRIKGPHGITLLEHARAGAERALPVLRHLLESLGDADAKPAVQPLSDPERAALEGRYRFGSGPRDYFQVATEKQWFQIQRAGGSARPLAHLGGRTFWPAGAEAVRIRFSGESPALSFTIHDPDLVIAATRVPS